MNTPEPEGGNNTKLIAYDTSGNVFIGVPIEINSKAYRTNSKGTLDVKLFVGQRIRRVLLNGIQLQITNTGFALRKGDILYASIRTKTVKIISSDNTLLPHPELSPES